MIHMARFILVTPSVSSAATASGSSGAAATTTTLAQLYAVSGIQSIQFVQFDPAAATSDSSDNDGSTTLLLLTVQCTVDYTDLVSRLAPARDIILKRRAVTTDPATNRNVSEYYFPVEKNSTCTVMLFHTTDNDEEYVDTGNLLSTIITFETLIYPEYRPLYKLPVYRAF
jgi:hypothetical protein